MYESSNVKGPLTRSYRMLPVLLKIYRAILRLVN
jgi:hypothetical protein